MKTFTIGEIVRQGLLKNHKGEPYKSKITVSRLVKKAKRVSTPFGKGYAVSEEEIARLNRRFTKS